MHSRILEDALRDFVEEAAMALQGELARGAEIPFELASNPARRRRGAPALHSYRPLTDAFIAERWPKLRMLAAHEAARKALDAFHGLDRYVAAHGRPGHPRPRATGAPSAAEEGLLVFVGDVFDEQTDFQLHPRRLEEALARLDAATAAEADSLTLVATLHGVSLVSAEVALAHGLTIAKPASQAGLPEEAMWGPPAGGDAGARGRGRGGREPEAARHLLVLLTLAGPHDSIDSAIAAGRELLGDLLRALRLFGDARIALGPMAWARCGGEDFEPVALGFGGRPHGMLLITPEQEDELRAFCSLVGRRAPRGGPLAWALRRFEMGAERRSDHEALSDHLLGLQALLDPDRGSPGLLAARVAALCALSERRQQTARRVLDAFELERATIEGTANMRTAEIELAREVAGHLRALLADVICGHLDDGLQTLADELLLGEQAPAQERPPAQASVATARRPAPARADRQGEDTTVLRARRQGRPRPAAEDPLEHLSRRPAV